MSYGGVGENIGNFVTFVRKMDTSRGRSRRYLRGVENKKWIIHQNFKVMYIPYSNLIQRSAKGLRQALCLSFLIPVLSGCGGQPASPAPSAGPEAKADSSLIFDKGEIVPFEHYTGTVWVSVLADNDRFAVTQLIFEPGVRNDWHLHPGARQTLLVLDGEGYYQEEGQPKRHIKKGDVIVTAPNVKHWNAAAPGTWLVHMTVTDKSDLGHAEWFEKVTDEEYNQ